MISKSIETTHTIHWSGQIIATSHNLTPNGGLVREVPLFQGNLGWWNILIWPDWCIIRQPTANPEDDDDEFPTKARPVGKDSFVHVHFHVSSNNFPPTPCRLQAYLVCRFTQIIRTNNLSMIVYHVIRAGAMTYSPSKFNIAPEKLPSQRKVVFQPSFFRGYVNKLRECTSFFRVT